MLVLWDFKIFLVLKIFFILPNLILFFSNFVKLVRLMELEVLHILIESFSIFQLLPLKFEYKLRYLWKK